MLINGFYSLRIWVIAISIDETFLSNGELYTIVTNKAAKERKGAMIAIVKGAKANEVIEVLERIPVTIQLKFL